MKEHIDAGFITSFIVSSLLFAGHAKGLVPTLHDLFVLMLFGWIGIVIGSDLPDIDSRTAPIHSFLGIGGIEFESAEGESLAELLSRLAQKKEDSKKVEETIKDLAAELARNAKRNRS